MAGTTRLELATSAVTVDSKRYRLSPVIVPFPQIWTLLRVVTFLNERHPKRLLTEYGTSMQFTELNK